MHGHVKCGFCIKLIYGGCVIGFSRDCWSIARNVTLWDHCTFLLKQIITYMLQRKCTVINIDHDNWLYVVLQISSTVILLQL